MILDKVDKNSSIWSYFNAYCTLPKSCTRTEYTMAENEPSMQGLGKNNPAPQGSTWQLLSALELQQLPHPKYLCLEQTK